MSEGSVRFAARWSRFVWGTTVGVLALIVVAQVLLIRAASEDQAARMLALVAALVSVSIFGMVGWFAPRGYLVGPDGIVVRRLGPPLVIPHRRIREVRPTDSGEIGFAWRVFGSGGFLGWFGRFRSRGLGEFRAYATNRQDLVLITKTNGRKIVISPHPLDAFLTAVQRHREQTA
ncbi:MAG: hypothetical protein FJ280_04275 [Planctomycetes bacterium]|nr:hypothetical protein [Planctomycetota bacterium]